METIHITVFDPVASVKFKLAQSYVDQVKLYWFFFYAAISEVVIKCKIVAMAPFLRVCGKTSEI